MAALGLEFAAYGNFRIWVRGGITDTFFRIYFFRNYFFIEDYINCVKISADHHSHPHTITLTLTLKVVSHVRWAQMSRSCISKVHLILALFIWGYYTQKLEIMVCLSLFRGI
jgi:hypothetical protein